MRFLKHKNYNQAIKCFTYSEDRLLAVRCRGYMLAMEGQQLMNTSDSIAWELNNWKKGLGYRIPKQLRAQKLEEIKQTRQESSKLF